MKQKEEGEKKRNEWNEKACAVRVRLPENTQDGEEKGSENGRTQLTSSFIKINKKKNEMEIANERQWEKKKIQFYILFAARRFILISKEEAKDKLQKMVVLKMCVFSEASRSHQCRLRQRWKSKKKDKKIKIENKNEEMKMSSCQFTSCGRHWPCWLTRNSGKKH